ncbi:unnamed protein product, partial [Amoebophrya sp. A120]
REVKNNRRLLLSRRAQEVASLLLSAETTVLRLTWTGTVSPAAPAPPGTEVPHGGEAAAAEQEGEVQGAGEDHSEQSARKKAILRELTVEEFTAVMLVRLGRLGFEDPALQQDTDRHGNPYLSVDTRNEQEQSNWSWLHRNLDDDIDELESKANRNNPLIPLDNHNTRFLTNVIAPRLGDAAFKCDAADRRRYEKLLEWAQDKYEKSASLPVLYGLSDSLGRDTARRTQKRAQQGDLEDVTRPNRPQTYEQPKEDLCEVSSSVPVAYWASFPLWPRKERRKRTVDDQRTVDEYHKQWSKLATRIACGDRRSLLPRDAASLVYSLVVWSPYEGRRETQSQTASQINFGNLRMDLNKVSGPIIGQDLELEWKRQQVQTVWAWWRTWQEKYFGHRDRNHDELFRDFLRTHIAG